MPVIPDPPATTTPAAFKAALQAIADFLNSIQDGTGEVQVVDEAYNATNWNGSLEVPTKNALRDKIEDILDGVTFTGDVVVPDEAYGSGWNASLEVPTKNAVYDKIESVTVSAGWVPLETETLGSSATSIDFSSIPATYEHLEIRGVLRSDRAGNTSDGVTLNVNNDTTDANYDRQNLSSVGAVTTSVYAANNRTLGVCTAATATADQFAEVAIRISRYAGATRKVVSWESAVPTTAGTALEIHERSCLWKSTTAINRITLLPSAGTNFIAGSSLTLYGLKGA